MKAVCLGASATTQSGTHKGANGAHSCICTTVLAQQTAESHGYLWLRQRSRLFEEPGVEELRMEGGDSRQMAQCLNSGVFQHALCEPRPAGAPAGSQ